VFHRRAFDRWLGRLAESIARENWSPLRQTMSSSSLQSSTLAGLRPDDRWLNPRLPLQRQRGLGALGRIAGDPLGGQPPPAARKSLDLALDFEPLEADDPAPSIGAMHPFPGSAPCRRELRTRSSRSGWPAAWMVKRRGERCVQGPAFCFSLGSLYPRSGPAVDTELTSGAAGQPRHRRAGQSPWRATARPLLVGVATIEALRRAPGWIAFLGLPR